MKFQDIAKLKIFNHELHKLHEWAQMIGIYWLVIIYEIRDYPFYFQQR